MHASFRLAMLACVSCALLPASGRAAESAQSEIQALKEQVKTLRSQFEALVLTVKQVRRPSVSRPKRAPSGHAPGGVIGTMVPASAVAPAAKRPSPTTQETTVLASKANAGPPIYSHGYFERKPGATLTFYVPDGEITGYGNLDVSFDVASKGMGSLSYEGTRPIGVTGWQPDISTNLSFVGVRGFENIPGQPFSLVYQLETQLDLSATSGTGESNSNQSNVVKGGLTSRNTYIGVSNSAYGALLIGKTDAPYKVATARLNPFLGTFGDYAAIMGNTGGDNRVEFGGRLDHAVWYQSPEFLHGLQFNALYSPGQNRASDSDNIAAGESDCTGGNIPGSGGSNPYACNDGAFSDAFSTSLTYTRGPLYVVAAYERHEKVNRSSDLTGEYASPPPLYSAADTAAEDAAKIAVQYTLPTRTTIGAIVESLHRYVPSFLAFQNERQRTGFWLQASQRVTKKDLVSAGWAHANRTPGDPGQHNTSLAAPPLGSPGDAVGGAGVDNSANLITVEYVHTIGAGLSTYLDWATILNGPYAHYALGAGGRAVSIDCHDASDATGGFSSNPHCWAGGDPQGASVGLRYQF